MKDSDKYTINIIQKHWRIWEIEALNSLAKKHNISINEVQTYMKDLELDPTDVDSYFQGILDIASSNYLEKVISYCEDNGIDYTNSKLVDYGTKNIFDIRISAADSDYYNDIGELIELNPNEENIKKMLKFLKIGEKMDKNLNLLLKELKKEYNDVEYIYFDGDSNGEIEPFMGSIEDIFIDGNNIAFSLRDQDDNIFDVDYQDVKDCDVDRYNDLDFFEH